MREHAFLETLYASAAGIAPWDEAFAQMNEYLGIEGTLLIDTRPTGFIAVQSKSLEASTQTYQRQQWFRLDERYRAVPAMRRGHVVNDLDLLSMGRLNEGW
jgi:hypothetical protein